MCIREFCSIWSKENARCAPSEEWVTRWQDTKDTDGKCHWYQEKGVIWLTVSRAALVELLSISFQTGEFGALLSGELMMRPFIDGTKLYNFSYRGDIDRSGSRDRGAQTYEAGPFLSGYRRRSPLRALQLQADCWRVFGLLKGKRQGSKRPGANLDWYI
jgi:hypothetical protein